MYSKQIVTLIGIGLFSGCGGPMPPDFTGPVPPGVTRNDQSGLSICQRPMGGGELRQINPSDVAAGPLTGSTEGQFLPGYKTPTGPRLPGATGNVTATGSTPATTTTTGEGLPPAPRAVEILPRPPYEPARGEVVVYIPEDAAMVLPLLSAKVAKGTAIDTAVEEAIADAQKQSPQLAAVIADVRNQNPGLKAAVAFAQQQMGEGKPKLTVIQVARK